MTPTPLPGLDLDLEYPAADPAVRLAERAVLAGRRRRRRNRAAAVAAALLVTAGVAGSWRAAVGPQDTVPVAAGSSELPASHGDGPERRAFIDPSYRGPLGRDDGPAFPGTPYPDRYVDLGPAGGTARAVAYQTRDGWFCLGSQATPGALPESSACRVIDRVPAEGIWVGTATVTTTLSPQATVVSSGDPVMHTLKAGPGRLIVMGVVRGPLGRVTVDLLGGRSLPTRLVPAPNPLLGTVFFAQITTDQYERALASVGPARPGGPVVAVPLGVTVYRGRTPVFHCDEQNCPGP